MATTSIGSDRPDNRAFEVYTDAAFLRDDHKLYFGDGGDFSMEYDEDGNDVVATAGADIRISDSQQIQFGDDGDTSISYDATSDCFYISGKNINITVTSDLTFSGLPTVKSDALVGSFYVANGSDLLIRVS